MITETNKKYQVKAKDSFRTKLRMYIFSKVINDKESLTLEDFNKFEITRELVEIYTTKYWQYNRDKNVYNELTPDDIYFSIKKFEESNIVFLKELEKHYIENFKDVFPEKDFEEIISRTFCEYCYITEEKILKLAEYHKLYKKNERGWKLEIDRKNSNYEYSKDNCVMACYWCNNAKTDEFTHVEFIDVGLAIKKIWESRLK